MLKGLGQVRRRVSGTDFSGLGRRKHGDDGRKCNMSELVEHRRQAADRSQLVICEEKPSGFSKSGAGLVPSLIC